MGTGPSVARIRQGTDSVGQTCQLGTESVRQTCQPGMDIIGRSCQAEMKDTGEATPKRRNQRKRRNGGEIN